MGCYQVNVKNVSPCFVTSAPTKEERNRLAIGALGEGLLLNQLLERYEGTVGSTNGGWAQPSLNKEQSARYGPLE